MAWPISVKQKFSQSGFSYEPFSNTIASDTSHGVVQTRRRFTGKMPKIKGKLYADSMDAVNDFMQFYYDEAEEGAQYFDFDNPFDYVGAPGNIEVRMSSKPIVTPRGGAGFWLSVEFEYKPFTTSRV